MSTFQIFSPLDIESLKSKLSSKAKPNKHIPQNPLLQQKFPQNLPLKIHTQLFEKYIEPVVCCSLSLEDCGKLMEIQLPKA